MKPSWVPALCLLMGTSALSQAHRLDELLQSTTVRVLPDRVALHVRLDPGTAVAQQVWDGIDQDHDGALSGAEQQAYVARLLADLSLAIDGRSAALEVISAGFPSQPDVLKGIGRISVSLQAPWILDQGAHRLRLVSRHQRAISAYLVNTLVPDDPAIRITAQQRSADQREYDLDFTSGDSVLPALK